MLFEGMKKAFSLVELSIVLVILGLLTGGILAGQALIKAAELRNVAREYTKFQTAMLTFKDKYFNYPGDMTNATAFWGKDNANCPGDTGTAATPGTCNGNGDGILTAVEGLRAWQQLANAALIEGSYTGTGSGAPGVNVPQSKYGGGTYGYQIFNYTKSSYNWTTGPSSTDTINHYRFGVASTCCGGEIIDGNQFATEDAWNIDTKLDDAKPAFGKVWARSNSCATSTNTTAADYALTTSGNVCGLLFTLN